MPLELNPLETSSLAPGIQIEGAAIRKLLQHYNQQDNVQVHLEHRSREELVHTLDEIASDEIASAADPAASGKTHLIVINVNSLHKGFDPGNQSHYVGIIINKPAGAGAVGGQYTIQYIDPMSHSINKDIERTIKTHLRLDDRVSVNPYRGSLQIARVSAEEGRIVGNDVDCGVMLTYLMTKASHNQGLPSGAFSGDLVMESRLIGEGLRTIFLGDNGKEPEVSTNIVDLSLSDIRARAPSARATADLPVENAGRGISGRELLAARGATMATLPEDTMHSTSDHALALLADKGATIAALSGEVNNSILRDSSSLLKRTSANPDVVSRRLDSLARLITGRDVCAAVAFDGERILFANNNNNNSLLENHEHPERSIARNVFLLLSYIAKNDLTQSQIDSSEIPEIMENLVSTAVREYKKGFKRIPEDLPLYETRVRRDINKLVNSLAVDGDETRRFPRSIREAFKRGIEGGVEFVPGREVSIRDSSTGKEEDRRVIVHAEMAILDRIITSDDILVSDKEVTAGRKPLYVGITMLCCRDCRNAIVAFNEVSSQTPVSATGSSPPKIQDASFHTIGTRGQHLMQFPWGSPRFFELRPAIKAKHDEIVRRLSRRHSVEPGKPMSADLSDSDPESDHTTISIRRSSAHSSLDGLRSLLAATSVRSVSQAPRPGTGTHERHSGRKK